MTLPKFFLDTRRISGEMSPLRISLNYEGKRKLISLGIKLPAEYWNAQSGTLSSKYPNAVVLNQRLRQILTAAEEVFMQASFEGWADIELVANKILEKAFPDKEPIQKIPEDNLLKVFTEFMNTKTGNTQYSYRQTYNRLLDYSKVVDVKNLRISDMKKPWLDAFDSFLSKSAKSPNSRAVYMRNLRAVCNYAIDCEYTTNYPFRRFHIKTVETAKRSLSVMEIRKIICLKPHPKEALFRDMFLLSFFLIGINFADMMNLPVNADANGYIEFYRSKTKKLYRIKIEPEAQMLINENRGKDWLLSIRDKYVDATGCLKATNNALSTMGNTVESASGKLIYSPIFPNLTTYWARHTWATIASELDIPKDTIAAALGHGGNTVTDIYINFNQKKIEAANRKVLDYVLYNER